jgi:hypothetical protein
VQGSPCRTGDAQRYRGSFPCLDLPESLPFHNLRNLGLLSDSVCNDRDRIPAFRKELFLGTLSVEVARGSG